jgi:hypothetical protein
MHVQLCHCRNTYAAGRMSAMKATELLKLMNRNPFQPLEIHLNDGSVLTVHEPFEIAVQRTSPCFVVYPERAVSHTAHRAVAPAFMALGRPTSIRAPGTRSVAHPGDNVLRTQQ